MAESTTPTQPPPSDGASAILKLAWPIVVSRSSQAVIGLADAMMVAHLGEAALAATSAGAFNTYALLILPMGITFIVSSFSSQLTGAGDAAGARKYGYYGLFIALATQLAAIVSVPLVPAALKMLPYSDDLRTLMQGYLEWRLLSGGAAIGVEALSNYYGGLGNTKLPMRVSVLAMTLNVAFCWVLIDGHLGAPALGVRGSAIANLIATMTAFLAFLVVFLRDGRTAPGVFRQLKTSEFMRMLRFGIPSGLNWFFEFFAFNFFINVVVAGLGTTALAAMMAVFQLNSVSFMPAFGLASAGSILVGQALGAKDPDRVPRTVLRTFGLMACWQVAIGCVYLTIPSVVLSLFTSEHVEAAGFLAVGGRILKLSVAWQLFDALSAALSESLRAAGDTAFTLWARMIISWCLFVPGSYVTVRLMHWQDVGAMSWVVFYLAALAFVLLLRFRTGRWRTIALLDREGAPAGH
jgi:MATE family multidrug resistance protein